MKIIKRNGSEVQFDLEKIVNAINAANAEVTADERLTERLRARRVRKHDERHQTNPRDSLQLFTHRWNPPPS